RAGHRLAASGARPRPAAPLGATAAGARPGLQPRGVVGGPGPRLPAGHGPRGRPGPGVGRRRPRGGSVLVADERVADTFTAPGDATERLMYGWSILHCLPATLAEDPLEATGTVLRAPTLARWVAAAGFTDFKVLAIDNPFWRFYRLRG
ncbi:MAG TPA: hypothetical protein VFS70_22290, partial [Actinomycetota bacterium]|nr:hypothetical protein [Actinomycetota bacterium]